MIAKKGFAGIIFLTVLAIASLNMVSALDDGSQFVYDLSSGITRTFYAGNVLGFNVLGGRHIFLLVGIKDELVNVKLSEPVQTAAMSAGEEKRFDFNGDGIMDVYVKINDVVPSGVTNFANVTIRTIAEQAASPVTNPVEPVAPEPVAPAASAGEEQKGNAGNVVSEAKAEAKSSNVWIGIAVVAVVLIAAYFVFKYRKRHNPF